MKALESFRSKHAHRIIGLDVLRSFAILLVLYGHGINLIPHSYYSLYSRFSLVRIDGVSVFFVLSGFLIGGMLLKMVSQSDFSLQVLLNFLIRRWFKTLPSYFLVLAVLLLFQGFYSHKPGGFNLSYLIFSQNLVSKHPDFFPEAWSLSMEEWFYFSFPVFWFLIHKVMGNFEKSFLSSVLFFLIMPLVFRIIKFEFLPETANFDLEFRKVILGRLDCMMYGVLAVYLQWKRYPFWEKYRTRFLQLGWVLILLLIQNPFNWKYAYPPLIFNIESITVLCFLPYLSSVKTTRSTILDSFFIGLSLLAYAAYLTNLTLVQGNLIPLAVSILSQAGMDFTYSALFQYSLYWVFTLSISLVLYNGFEYPLTEWRKKFQFR